MTYSYTSPDGIPYPLSTSKIGDTTGGEDLRQLLQQQAATTQTALSGRDSSLLHMHGSADGMNLDNLVNVTDFGWHEFTSFGGATPIPPGLENRAELFVHGGSGSSVIQEATARELNTTWQRTCLDANATPKVWTRWKTTLGACGTANGLELNNLHTLLDFGTYDITYSGGAKNMPAAFFGSGKLIVSGATKFTVTQTLISRDQQITWQREGTNTSGAVKVWSEWVIVSAPYLSNPSQVVVGDSLGNLLATNVGTVIPDGVSNRGYSGETTDGINLRLGAKRTIWNVAGGTIPASGSVTLTTDMALALPEFNTFYTGHLNGIDGKIDWVGADGTFTFTRDVAGTAVPVTGKAVFEPRWTAQVRFMSLTVSMGRNDITLNSVGADVDTVTHIKANYVELFNWAKAERKNLLFLGTLNRTTEPAGHANHTRNLELDEWLKDTYPGHYLNWRRYIIDQVIYDLGITPNAEDLANMANDCPPPSVMADPTHPTPAAATATWENLIRPWQLAKGWY